MSKLVDPVLQRREIRTAARRAFSDPQAIENALILAVRKLLQP